MSDSEDEVQDWRSLDARVLKRGEKDHAPDGTIIQQTTLQQSREAMYAALSKPASSLSKHVVECDWDPVHHRGIVRKVKGNYFTTMGWAESTQTYAHPEEIIYLVQRGSMLCFYKNLPLSVEGTMSLMLNEVGTDKLHVYTHLKRLGYVVRRAVREFPDPQQFKNSEDTIPNSLASSLVWFIVGNHFDKMAWKPFYSAYPSVYKSLQWVSTEPLHTRPSDHIFDFHVWKPCTKFKRSQPSPPEFRIRVVSADMPLPELSSIQADFQTIKAVQSEKKSAVYRMREGCRQFIYAVVDNGVVSFVRASEPQVESIYSSIA